MKKYFKSYILITALLVAGCQQEIAELTPPAEPTGEPGSADFTMFVSVGNSLTAGFQAGALFTEGQNNSYPSIMAKQFALVSENDEFNQPDINSVNGYNSTYSNPGGGIIRGRLVLFDADGPLGPKTPAPAPAGAPGVPAPYNNGELPAAYTGDKTKLNNFGVPGIILRQGLEAGTGNPASPYYNPLWARFASAPGVKSILTDAADKQPTFFSFWLGNNDILGYATSGGAGAAALTDPTLFEADYRSSITQLLAVSANTKGVVATIPNVTSIPFFRTVGYNVVNFNATNPVDVGTVAALNTNFAGLNGALDAIVQFLGHNAADAAKRKVQYATGPNPILIHDESLTDLSSEFDMLRAANAINDAQRTALQPYVQSRPAASDDLILLSAGAVIGTGVGGSTTVIYGVSYPLPDQYVLVQPEREAIATRTTAFNDIIREVVDENPTRLALADINAKFNDVVTLATRQVDGIPVNATFAPPTGLFSEDGVHPNNRGSAYIAKVFIEAINAKFGATVPLPNIATYKSTGLPVNTTIAP